MFGYSKILYTFVACLTFKNLKEMEKINLKEEYQTLLKLVGIMNEWPKSSEDDIKKHVIATYLLLELFVKRAKDEKFIYDSLVDDYLCDFKKSVYNYLEL